MEFKRQLKKNPRIIINYLLCAPFIYAQVVGLVFLDITIEIYHRICFPLCGLPTLKRRDYIRIDRQKLAYLTRWEKINCMYCGYANGVLHYISAIAGATEKYWCGIMHAKYQNFQPAEHQKDFLPYGDEKAFKEFMDS